LYNNKLQLVVCKKGASKRLLKIIPKVSMGSGWEGTKEGSPSSASASSSSEYKTLKPLAKISGEIVYCLILFLVLKKI